MKSYTIVKDDGRDPGSCSFGGIDGRVNVDEKSGTTQENRLSSFLRSKSLKMSTAVNYIGWTVEEELDVVGGLPQLRPWYSVDSSLLQCRCSWTFVLSNAPISLIHKSRSVLDVSQGVGGRHN